MPTLSRALRKTSARRARAPQAGGGGSRTLLDQPDITYVGYHTLGDLPGNHSLYALGLTVKYSGATQRFVTLDYANSGGVGYRPQEITLAGNPATGGTVTNGTHWDSLAEVWGGSTLSGQSAHMGLWWEESEGRLWWSLAGDYPQGSYTSNNCMILSTRQLASNGTASGFRGLFGMEGIGTRALLGGVRKVPTWFRTANSTGPYVTGWGGYSSLAGQGLGPSYGPMFVFIPDPHNYTDNPVYEDTTANIPATDFKIGADCRSGALNGQFASYSSRTWDRGVRKTLTYDNWFDSSDSRSNPTTRPTYPTDYTAAGTWWGAAVGGATAGDPDGYGRWTWGDSYHSTLNWIDNDAGARTRHGIVAVATLCGGYGYYANSTLNSDSRVAEIHVYDPADVALVLAGSLAPYKLRPSRMWDITAQLNSLVSEFGGGGSGTAEPGAIVAADFDPLTSRLYALQQVLSSQNAGLVSRIHVWDVAA